MSFCDIKGQKNPLKLLREHLKHGRLGQSYLFCGPEGIGKKLTAKTLAKALNCRLEGLDSCDSCPSCLKIEQLQHPDIHFIGDGSAAQIKIEEVRQLQKEASLRPYEAKKKVFIIDNAHNLTADAANALLKTLEDPPGHCLIILISSKPGRLFKTIVSRCRIFKFYPLALPELEEVLNKDYAIEKNPAHFLAFFSEGRLGAALSLKNSDIFMRKNRVTASSDFSYTEKEEFRKALNILAVWFRDLYLLKAGLNEDKLANLDRRADLLQQAKACAFGDLDKALAAITESMLYLEQNINLKLMAANLKFSLRKIITHSAL